MIMIERIDTEIQIVLMTKFYSWLVIRNKLDKFYAEKKTFYI